MTQYAIGTLRPKPDSLSENPADGGNHTLATLHKIQNRQFPPE